LFLAIVIFVISAWGDHPLVLSSFKAGPSPFIKSGVQPHSLDNSFSSCTSTLHPKCLSGK